MWVWSLGIIVIYNSILFCHIFNTMFDSLELFQRSADHIYRNPICCCHSGCCHRILMIVRSKNIQFIYMAYRCLLSVHCKNDLTVFQIDSFF